MLLLQQCVRGERRAVSRLEAWKFVKNVPVPARRGGSAGGVAEEARRLLAWEKIDGEKEQLRLDDTQGRQLRGNLEKAQRDLREAVWRAYRHLYLLGRDNTVRHLDPGLVHSSAAATLPAFVLTQLRQHGELEDSIGANRLRRSWPPAFSEWSTLAVRNAFFASPQFPRLLNGNVLKDTIAKGVTSSLLAYVSKRADGIYEPFRYNSELSTHDVELSEDVYIIKAETAENYLMAQRQRHRHQLLRRQRYRRQSSSTGSRKSRRSTFPTSIEKWSMRPPAAAPHLAPSPASPGGERLLTGSGCTSTKRCSPASLRTLD